jgi:hypothetical protein
MIDPRPVNPPEYYDSGDYERDEDHEVERWEQDERGRQAQWEHDECWDYIGPMMEGY